MTRAEKYRNAMKDYFSRVVPSQPTPCCIYGHDDLAGEIEIRGTALSVSTSRHGACVLHIITGIGTSDRSELAISLSHNSVARLVRELQEGWLNDVD